MNSCSNFKGLIFLFSFCLMAFHAAAQTEEIGPDKFNMIIDGHNLKIPYYANYDINTVDNTVDKLVIVVQGSNRNAGIYYNNMRTAAGSSASFTTNTLIVSPQFLIEEDIDFHNLDAEHLYWSNGGWKSGSLSKDEFTNPRPARIPSYEVLDRLLIHLADNFPKLESVVLTGHSAGGQLAQRMAATSPAPDVLCAQYGIDMSFISANPSSYAYMNEERRLDGSMTEFAIPATSCYEYNDWKYGLYDLYTYGEQFGADVIRERFGSRRMSYLIGKNDNDPNFSNLDVSCPAMLQGAHRLERAITYFNYVKHYYGESITDLHELVQVPGVGHNSLDIYNSTPGRKILFETEFDTCDSTVGTSNAFDKKNIKVYPNPTNNLLNISVPWTADREISLSIFNAQGHQVKKIDANADDVIDLSDLAAGYFIIAIQSAKESYSTSFIKL